MDDRANLTAERNVLSALTFFPGKLAEVPNLTPTDFYAPAHQLIFEAIQKLSGEVFVLDETLIEEWIKSNRPEIYSGAISEACDNLTRDVITDGLLIEHAKIVKDYSKRRRALTIGKKLEADMAFSRGTEELLSQASRDLEALAVERAMKSDRTTPDIVRDAFDEIFNSDATSSLETGYYDIDHITGGMDLPSLVILAARPSVGKSSFAYNVALDLAKNGTPVSIFSLEVSPEQVSKNMMAIDAGVDSMNIRKRTVSEEDHRKMKRSMDLLCNIPLEIHDTYRMTTATLRQEVRQAVQRRNLKFVVIDYLQLLTPDDDKRNRVEQIGRISREIQQLAMDEGIVIMALSQLNRDLEKEKRPPRLSDLRESGSLEQDATVVMLMHRPHLIDGETDPSHTDMIIAKNKNGRTGPTVLHFQPECYRFRSMVKERVTYGQ